MIPSIGRIVHFHNEVAVDPNKKDSKTEIRTFPAIIIEVKNDTALVKNGDDIETIPTLMVGLQLFGTYCNAMSLSFYFPYSETPKAGHWSWPPKI